MGGASRRGGTEDGEEERSKREFGDNRKAEKEGASGGRKAATAAEAMGVILTIRRLRSCEYLWSQSLPREQEEAGRLVGLPSPPSPLYIGGAGIRPWYMARGARRPCKGFLSMNKRLAQARHRRTEEVASRFVNR
ncbi:hypothetical protein BHM03_00036183 [Ensete ventricosum]|nr:hypothetical protein BHM03_00036183 [Ensete ventricosum]